MEARIDWKQYSDTQISSAKSYGKKTAPRGNLSACATLAARAAMSDGRRVYLVATHSGYTLCDSAPPFGQKALVFERDRYGELVY